MANWHARVPPELICDRRLSHALFRLLVALLLHVNKSGWCRVRLRTLARDLGTTRSTVGSHLGQLERRGYISRYATPGETGKGRGPNVYRVHLRVAAPELCEPVVHPCPSHSYTLSESFSDTLSEPVAHKEQHQRTNQRTPPRRRRGLMLETALAEIAGWER